MELKYKVHADDYHANRVADVSNQIDAYRLLVAEQVDGLDVTNVELAGCGGAGRRCLWCQDHAIGTVPVANIGRGDVCWTHAAELDHPDTRLGFDITRNSAQWTGD